MSHGVSLLLGRLFGFLRQVYLKINPFLARGTPLPYALMIQDDGNQLVRAPLGLIRAPS